MHDQQLKCIHTICHVRRLLMQHRSCLAFPSVAWHAHSQMPAVWTCKHADSRDSHAWALYRHLYPFTSICRPATRFDRHAAQHDSAAVPADSVCRLCNKDASEVPLTRTACCGQQVCASLECQSLEFTWILQTLTDKLLQVMMH